MEAGSKDMLLAIISNLRNAEYQLIVLEAHYNKEGNSLDASRVVRDLPGIQDTVKRLIQLVA